MIRTALPRDAEAIAHIQIDGWRSAYKNILPKSVLDDLNYEKKSEQILKRITGEDTDFTNHIIVYEENDHILGFTYYGKNLSTDDDTLGETTALYVEPTHKRKGIGKALITYVKEKLKNQGFTHMIIWCLKDNLPSIEFYKAMGGEITAERDFNVAGEMYKEVGLKYELK